MDLSILNSSKTAFEKYLIRKFRLVPNSVSHIHSPVDTKLQDNDLD